MAASYPTSVKSFSTKTDGQTIASSHVNDLQDEVVAVEGGLKNGVEHTLKPSSAGASDLGTSSLPWGTVHARVLDLDASTELTVSSGAVVVTRSYHSIDTEADAASDDLDTLTATGLTAGHVVIFKAENTSRVVTFKDGTGNLLLNGDYPLNGTDRTITLLYDGTNWRELARSVNNSAVLDKSTTEQDVQSSVVNTTETSVYSYSVPAGTLSTNRAIRLTLTGKIHTDTTTESLTIKVKFGGTTIANTGAVSYTATTNIPFELVCTINANNATNSQRAVTRWTRGAVNQNVTDGSFDTTSLAQVAQHTSLAIDTTAAAVLTVTYTWSTGGVTTSHAYRFLAITESLQ